MRRLTPPCSRCGTHSSTTKSTGPAPAFPSQGCGGPASPPTRTRNRSSAPKISPSGWMANAGLATRAPAFPAPRPRPARRSSTPCSEPGITFPHSPPSTAPSPPRCTTPGPGRSTSSPTATGCANSAGPALPRGPGAPGPGPRPHRAGPAGCRAVGGGRRCERCVLRLSAAVGDPAGAGVFLRPQRMRGLWRSPESHRRPDRSGLDPALSGGGRAAGEAPAEGPA